MIQENLLNQATEEAKAVYLSQRRKGRREYAIQENEITKVIVDLCVKIHKALGPGLLESAYEEVLIYELKKHGLMVAKQAAIPVLYEDIRMDIGFRADLIVKNKVIIELKSVENVMPVHKKQLLTYLRLSGLKLGLLVNFNEALMKNGITRIANGL